jgi:hypothetical protein
LRPNLNRLGGRECRKRIRTSDRVGATSKEYKEPR